jgi:3-hydroxyacyl-[acyl-carrier-protein] dehydratase
MPQRPRHLCSLRATAKDAVLVMPAMTLRGIHNPRPSKNTLELQPNNREYKMGKILLNRQQIMDIIPHRDPFLLIDEVLELEAGRRVLAVKRVRAEEYYFQGHFPQEKVMPGVLIVEALAQAGAAAILSMDAYRGKIAYFGGIKEAKFREKVVPGDVLMLEVTLERLRSRAGTGVATAKLGEKTACRCEILFAIGD